jgi:hypothetical protein
MLEVTLFRQRAGGAGCYPQRRHNAETYGTRYPDPALLEEIRLYVATKTEADAEICDLFAMFGK